MKPGKSLDEWGELKWNLNKYKSPRQRKGRVVLERSSRYKGKEV